MLKCFVTLRSFAFRLSETCRRLPFANIRLAPHQYEMIMLKNSMFLFKQQPARPSTDAPRAERRPLESLRQVSGAAQNSSFKSSGSGESTLRPTQARSALDAVSVRVAAAPIRGEAARLQYPLPEALVHSDPYAAPKPEGIRRPVSPGLRRKKSDSTLQLHKENTLAELAAPPKESEVDRKAREKWRYMLGGRTDSPPQVTFGTPTGSIVEKAAHTDDLFLKRCERSTAGLSQAHRTEVEHIARYGLTQSCRERARDVLKKHDPYLCLLWRKVTNPAASLAQGTQSVVGGKAAKSCEPSIQLVQMGRPGGHGARARPAVAEVVSDTGSRYLVAQPSSGGGFKRFSVGLTAAGKPIAVLLMRGPQSRDVFGDFQGEDLELAAITEEIKNLSAFSDQFEIYDAFPVHNVWYIMVPLFDGGSLGDMFTRLSPNERYTTTLRLLPDMLKQILALHREHGALHRDVKMDNFFCTSLGDVVLADFGLTEKLDPNRAVNEGFGGTFFAPEQIDDMRITQAVDLWSLGASLGDLFIRPSRSVGALRNPHAPVYDQDGGYDPQGHKVQVNLFGQFRKLLFDNAQEGLFDPNRLDRIQLKKNSNAELANMVNYYREFNSRAPLVARFCLEHLLEPNPALRSHEDGQVFLQLAHIMADAMGQSSVSSAARKLPMDGKIAAAIEALKETQAKLYQNNARAA